MTEFTEYDMDLLVQAIEAEQCVFFLGPSATINYGRAGLLDQFLGVDLKNSLPKAHQASIMAYNPVDRFFILDMPASRNKLYKPLKEFYEEERPNALLDQLAEIPFHLAITVTPDLSLNQAFDRRGIPFSSEYFDKAVGRELAASVTISRDNPFLYNLLGSVSAYETLITTHLELFETLQAMFGGERMPRALVPKISSRNLQHVVFLGLEFDKWYYQLVMYLLKMNNSDVPRTAPNTGTTLADHTLEFCKTDFRINFISQDLKGFVAELHARFAGRQLLRKGVRAAKTSRKYSIARILKLLEKGIMAHELATLCMAHFPAVYQNFGPDQTTSLRINLLIDHCRQVDNFEGLLNACAQANPTQFQQWGPYHES